MHGTMIRPEAADQRLDVELCRSAAYRMPAVHRDGFAGGQGIGASCGAWRTPLEGSPQRRRWQANVGATGKCIVLLNFQLLDSRDASVV